MTWNVQIINSKTGEVVRDIPCDNQRIAERVERGANINLDHENFHTKIVDKE